MIAISDTHKKFTRIIIAASKKHQGNKDGIIGELTLWLIKRGEKIDEKKKQIEYLKARVEALDQRNIEYLQNTINEMKGTR